MRVFQAWLLTLVHVPEFTPTTLEDLVWPRVVFVTPNPSTLEVEAGELGVQGLHETCLKKKVKILRRPRYITHNSQHQGNTGRKLTIAN